MYAEESDHVEHIDPEIHACLSTTNLLALICARTGFDQERGKTKRSDVKNPKKRGHDDDSRNGTRKRAKVSSEEDVSISDRDEERLFHAYRRVFRLRYEYDGSGADGVEDTDWIEGKKELEDWLAVYERDFGEAEPIDLGLVSVDPFSYAISCVREPGNSARIFTLPQLRSSFSLEDHDFSTWSSLRDPLQAFQLLANSGRARIHPHLFLTCAPANEGKLPFTLRLEVDCSFVLPRIFEPFMVNGSKKSDKPRASDAQEAQRRLVLHLFPPQSPPPASYQGATDIPFLFSILRPAPALPSSKAYDALQPESLLPTLLPFQRRSVGWMLAREGKMVTASGNIVAKADVNIEAQTLPLFWEQFPVSTEETWYVNRLRGIISPTRPSGDEDALDEDVPGGIVAEEPGLGKTLECISTIMMNPAPERSPVNKRWDSEAKLDVREIKTTLIVTPPSLAPQWADELANHAPGVKVLIYEGWQKVPVPISEMEVALEREKRRKAKEQAKAKKTKPRPTKAKGKGKGRAKKDDDMAVDEEETAEVSEDEEDVVDWCSYVNQYDVCITTYNVLQQDLGVARPPPVRPRRAFVKYSSANRSRSPLVMCEWYRVIMDEVQMVGGGKAEEMVSLIPRLSSFAVSGTPARHQVADLVHVLRFLRVSAVVDMPRAWTRLRLPGYAHEFTELFRRYTVRTMKEAVKQELTIPPQTRFLVPITLGRVERHVYDQTFEAALLDLGLDARGVAASANWEVDVAKLRNWLRRLRGLCTHPQVGQLANNTVDKLHKPGVLKSMAEVLESMRDQNWRNYMDDRKTKLANMATLAQLLQHEKDNRFRSRQALDLLIEGEQDAERVLDEIKLAIEDHKKEGEKLKAELAQLRAAHRHNSTGASSDKSKDEQVADKGKGKATREKSETSDLDLEQDGEGLPRTPAGDAHRAKSTSLVTRLRELRIVLHKIKFLQGDVYHILGSSYEEAEANAYAAADNIRRLLLKSNEEGAERAMTYLDNDSVVKALKEKDLYVKIPYLGKGGIRSSHLMEEANELIDGLLNEQSALLWKWRQRLIELLTQPLGGTGEDVDGQEYNRTLETQGEAEVYLQAYAALLADRRETLTAERTLLAAHDVREVQARKMNKAQKQRATDRGELPPEDLIELERLDDREVLPEHEVVYKELNDARKTLLEEFDPGRAVKSIMVDLNNVAVSITKKEDPEKILAQDAVAKLRTLINGQNKLVERLQMDLSHLRKAFNERIGYFRQLQEISDTVAEAEWVGQAEDAIHDLREQQSQLDTKINAARARQRYLDNLSRSHEEGTLDEDDKSCILCKCDFVRGYITHCAHVYCEDCMKAWISRPGGKACPVCRVPINPDQLQRFTIDDKPDEPAKLPPKILDNNEVMPRSRREIQYNYIPSQILQDIQAMEVLGSYGSKIETLMQHLLYLQVTEPGTKSIIFSAWADSLTIIQHALSANAITCLRIDQNTGRRNAAKKFRTDPSISVLLLHGERENAGLNLTCASRVFLVESVVHHAFEVQAIARIDRMGQTRPTEVYCYYAEESVERNILDLAAKQGLSLYTRDNATGTLNVTPFAGDTDKQQVDAPTKKVQKGDFVYKTDDLLAIFFPHMFEDLEYLLSPEDLDQEATPTAGSVGTSQQEQVTIRRPLRENAVAGPSRLG